MRKLRNLAFGMYVGVDLFSACLSWVVLYAYRKFVLEPPGIAGNKFFTDHRFVFALVIIPAFWLFVYYISGTYTHVYRKSRLSESVKTLIQSLIGCIILFFAFLLDDIIRDYRNYYTLIGVLFAGHFMLTWTGRLLVLSYTKMQMRRGIYRYNTLIIGSNHNAVQLYKELQRSKSKVHTFHGFVEVIEGTANGLKEYLPFLGGLKELGRCVDEREIEEVIVAIESSEHEGINKVLNELADREVVIKIIPDLHDILLRKTRMNSVTETALIEMYPELLAPWERNVKRLIDILCSATAIGMLLPVYVYLAIRVKLSSSGPIFFRQERVGLYGRPFQILKFRSMYTNAEEAGPALSSNNDPRVTPFGRFMRKWRLDEIPQFINVLLGEMSLVGPRPERQFFIDQIIEKAPQYKHIQRVKPGITSLGMVKYGYAENVDQMVERLRYDLIYVENTSVFLDIKIMMFTLQTLIQGRGK